MSNCHLCGALFFLINASLYGQRVERAVIAASGASGTAASASLSWTVGEFATARYDFSDGALTQGFQQSFSPIALVRPENFAGNAGDTKEMRILFDQPGFLPFSTATAIRVKLRFNSTLLEPIATVPAAAILSDSIAYGRRTVELLLPAGPGVATSGTLATVRFRVGLGNDSLSTMELLDAVPVGGPLRVRALPGTFKLLGICYQGGPRLVDPVERVTVALRPNPVSTVGELEFDLRNDEWGRVMVVDLLGRTLMTVADEQMKAGHYTLSFDAGVLPAGSYRVVLETPTLRATRPMVVRR